MTSDLRSLLAISEARLAEVNSLLLDPNSQVINDFLAVVDPSRRSTSEPPRRAVCPISWPACGRSTRPIWRISNG